VSGYEKCEDWDRSISAATRGKRGCGAETFTEERIGSFCHVFHHDSFGKETVSLSTGAKVLDINAKKNAANTFYYAGCDSRGVIDIICA